MLKNAPYNGKTQANHTQSQVRHSKRQPWNRQQIIQLSWKIMGSHFGEIKGGALSSIFASHTFHEIQMYYPMRVYRDKKFKLIWNIAHPLPYPFASDLWAASSFQLNFKSPSPHHMERKLFANTYTVRNSNSSGSTKTRKKQLIWQGIQSLLPYSKNTKKN